jgi:hypothetical protein
MVPVASRHEAGSVGTLDDRDLAAEIALLGEVLAAVATAAHELSESEVDEVLGVVHEAGPATAADAGTVPDADTAPAPDAGQGPDPDGGASRPEQGTVSFLAGAAWADGGLGPLPEVTPAPGPAHGALPGRRRTSPGSRQVT